MSGLPRRQRSTSLFFSPGESKLTVTSCPSPTGPVSVCQAKLGLGTGISGQIEVGTRTPLNRLLASANQEVGGTIALPGSV
ncbi:MAG: hypothetical protein R3E54_03725 [Halioglobus sp.]